jgi:thiamine-phosphate pyrophosphorylase
VNVFDPRLIVITDREMAQPRTVYDVIAAALDGGARTVQLRDKSASARELFEQASRLLPVVHDHGGVLFVNDRLDVALAAGADGVHLGPGDLPVAVARKLAAPEFLIGFSTDDPESARSAERAGASYIGCGAVFGTSSKDVGGERIGTGRLDEVARAVSIPVVGIGGITLANAREVTATAAAGIAVIGAVMKAPEPRAATAGLLGLFPSSR